MDPADLLDWVSHPGFKEPWSSDNYLFELFTPLSRYLFLWGYYQTIGNGAMAEHYRSSVYGMLFGTSAMSQEMAFFYYNDVFHELIRMFIDFHKRRGVAAAQPMLRRLFENEGVNI